MLRTLSLDFRREGGIVYPRDPHLHKLAVEYCEKELVDKVNLADFPKVLVTCICDEDGNAISVDGIACGQNIVDFPVLRFTSLAAGNSLTERMRAYLDDLGLRGGIIFIHVANREPKESRCPYWRKVMRNWKAKKASRWTITV